VRLILGVTLGITVGVPDGLSAGLFERPLLGEKLGIALGPSVRVLDGPME
jgi:hypothetical protein